MAVKNNEFWVAKFQNCIAMEEVHLLWTIASIVSLYNTEFSYTDTYLQVIKHTSRLLTISVIWYLGHSGEWVLQSVYTASMFTFHQLIFLPWPMFTTYMFIRTSKGEIQKAMLFNVVVNVEAYGVRSQCSIPCLSNISTLATKRIGQASKYDKSRMIKTVNLYFSLHCSTWWWYWVPADFRKWWQSKSTCCRQTRWRNSDKLYSVR